MQCSSIGARMPGPACACLRLQQAHRSCFAEEVDLHLADDEGEHEVDQRGDALPGPACACLGSIGADLAPLG